MTEVPGIKNKKLNDQEKELEEQLPKSDSEHHIAKNQPKKHHKHHHKHHKSSTSDKSLFFARWSSKRFFVTIFSFFVVVFAGFYGAKESGVVELPDIQDIRDFDLNFDFNFDLLKDNLPGNFLSILKEARDESGGQKYLQSTDDFVVGKYMVAEQSATAHFPVVMVPGVVSTGLESWSLTGTPECPSEPHFRKRLWGSFYMLKEMFLNKNCWLKNIMLDPQSGLDPPNFKLRAASGFEAADFFVTGYWIWNKIVSNLAVLGYTSNEMMLHAYDWRLAYFDLERRDSYFTRLKFSIENFRKTHNNKKVVLYGHSMGSQIIFYFLKWVEAEGYGNGGSDWVNNNIEAFVDISGSTLGTPKALTALLSGEMKDTIQLNAVAVYGLEKFFSRKERVDMLRSFGGIPAMLPKGGDVIWGNLTSAPDDIYFNKTLKNSSFGSFIKFKKNLSEFSAKNLSMQSSIDYLLEHSEEWFKNRVYDQYSFGIVNNPKQLALNNQDHSKWSNPLEVPLPNAPELKVYCFYGVGNPTERSYLYQEEQFKNISKLNISMAYGDKETVSTSDGDGTVSILTHTMCHKWKEENSIYNPGNAKVTIVELKHEPERFDMRGGSKTSEHVDILGSSELNELLIKVASGKGDEIEDRIISQLPEFIKNMNWPQLCK